MSLVTALLAVASGLPAQEPAPAADLQAVVETSLGEFVMEFYGAEAPNHVRHFIEQVEAGAYTNTTFHSMVHRGIVQGGDPTSRDPDRRAEYGTGGFHSGPAAEFSDIEFVAGTVVTTLLPGDDTSGGSQFFICVSDQPQFSGQFTAFGRVVEGIDVVEEISQIPTDEDQIALDRVEISGITLRRRPPPTPAPYSTETVQELRDLSVVMETSMGEIVIGLAPDVAPNHVRHFLRLTSLGVYDHTAFHRVAPGFVIQAGDLNTRTEPYFASAQQYVMPIAAELNDRRHVRGTVSLARGEDPGSGLTSFFIVLDEQPALDGVYTVFGEVISGLDTVDRIAGVATEDERPTERVDVYSMRVERRN